MILCCQLRIIFNACLADTFKRFSCLLNKHCSAFATRCKFLLCKIVHRQWQHSIRTLFQYCHIQAFISFDIIKFFTLLHLNQVILVKTGAILPNVPLNFYVYKENYLIQ